MFFFSWPKQVTYRPSRGCSVYKHLPNNSREQRYGLCSRFHGHIHHCSYSYQRQEVDHAVSPCEAPSLPWLTRSSGLTRPNRWLVCGTCPVRRKIQVIACEPSSIVPELNAQTLDSLGSAVSPSGAHLVVLTGRELEVYSVSTRQFLERRTIESSTRAVQVKFLNENLVMAGSTRGYVVILTIGQGASVIELGKKDDSENNSKSHYECDCLP